MHHKENEYLTMPTSDTVKIVIMRKIQNRDEDSNNHNRSQEGIEEQVDYSFVHMQHMHHMP